MTRQQYKGFYQTVANANEYSDVWYAGYLWLDFNSRQAEEIKKLLKVHPSIIRENGKLRMPSGIEIKE